MTFCSVIKLNQTSRLPYFFKIRMIIFWGQSQIIAIFRLEFDKDIKYLLLLHFNRFINKILSIILIKQSMMVPKKRVRICSVNSEKRKALTECTLDLNICPNSPRELTYSPKMQNFLRGKANETQLDENTSPSVNHKKILPRARAKTKKYEVEQQIVEGSQVKSNYTNAEFEKLIQITSRCVDYYNKQMETKEIELRVVKEAFEDIHERLNKAFNGIIIEVQNKHNQIKQFLNKKQNQLIQIKKDQQVELNANLNDVKSVQLMNLLTDYKNSEHGLDLNQQICTYASTLYRFYEAMERIEKQNFKQAVEQTINFINNIISEEIKYIVYEKIPNKSLNGSFSFNDGLGFGNSMASAIERRDSGEISNSLVSDEDHFGLKKGKQIREAWCQTLGEFEGKQSVLQMLNQIVKNQSQMKEKIVQYRGLQN